MAAEMSDSVE